MTEKQLEYYRNYYSEHKEQIKNNSKKWREENKERVLNYAKQYREEHPEAHAEWQRKNKDKLKAIKTRYRKKIALHKKRVKQAKRQCRDEKGRFCKWEDMKLDYDYTLKCLIGATLKKLHEL